MRVGRLLELRRAMEEARSKVHRSPAAFDADHRDGAVLLAPDGSVLARRVPTPRPTRADPGRREPDHPLAGGGAAGTGPWEGALVRDGHDAWS